MIKLNLDKKETYLLACSYGPDSMALLNLLLNGGYNFAVAHVNYGLREEARFETENLVDFCNKNSIKIYVKNVEEKIEKNIEKKCRDIRYLFFEEIMQNTIFSAVLVAHNLDDNLETYLLQKSRKNIVENFGLNRVAILNGYTVIRPLLDYTKDELLKYVETNHVPYCIDSSNLDEKFERNKIRKRVISTMSNVEKWTLLLEMTKKNNEMLKRRNSILREATNLISTIQGYLDEDLAYYLTVLGRKYVGDLELSMKRVLELKNVMLSEKPNVRVKIKGNLYFVKAYDRVYFTCLPKDTGFYYVIKEPCKFECEFFRLDFTGDTSDRNVGPDDYPLVIRNASKLDRVLVKDYYVSMRREFINWKMPEDLRKRWPVILNNKNEIVYVPRYNKNFKPSKDTNFVVVI